MNASAGWVPDSGDLVWLDLDPQAGHEQAGHRPALVLSPEVYNRRSGLIVCCPLTTRIKGYPFEVPVMIGKERGVVLSDQVKSLDWRTRRARKLDSAPLTVMEAVRARIKALLAIR